VFCATISKTQKLSQCAADEDSSLLSQTPVGSTKHYPEDGGRKSGRSDVAYIQYALCHTPEYSNLYVNPLKPELNPICYLLALLGAHHFLHVSRIRVKLLTFRRLMSYIYIYI